MEKKGFFRTKEGGLTLAFVAIMIAFVVILTGLRMDNIGISAVGLFMILAAMLYAPLKVFVFDRNKNKK